jgi:hypothetical protein
MRTLVHSIPDSRRSDVRYCRYRPGPTGARGIWPLRYRIRPTASAQTRAAVPGGSLPVSDSGVGRRARC